MTNFTLVHMSPEVLLPRPLFGRHQVVRASTESIQAFTGCPRPTGARRDADAIFGAPIEVFAVPS